MLLCIFSLSRQAPFIWQYALKFGALFLIRSLVSICSASHLSTRK